MSAERERRAMSLGCGRCYVLGVRWEEDVGSAEWKSEAGRQEPEA